MPNNFNLHELLADAINLITAGAATSHHEAISLALLRAGVMGTEGDNHRQYCQMLAQEIPEIQLNLKIQWGTKND